jgi:hypothetical protein
MNLLDVLAAGVSGAENGTATITKRGTGTAATYYLDFEGTAAIATGAALDLDENGRVLAYVNELVDVAVADADGTEILTFTAGSASGAIEYQGQSFTGTSYSTGAAAAGNPTNVQAILDLWLTNSGAVDWKVLVGSTPTKLSTALTGVSGMFFNVKDPTYGAMGDNVSNDAAAIGAAITAAATNGGIVFFPPGTYRCTTGLSLSKKVSILGCGPESSIITMDHASNSLITTEGTSNVDHQFIEGVQLKASQANSGNPLAITAQSLILAKNVYLGGSNNTGNLCSVAAGGGVSGTRLTMEDCSFHPGASTNSALAMASGAHRVRLNRCKFVVPASYTPTNGGMVYGQAIDFDNCYFDNSACTAGTYSCFKVNSTSFAATMMQTTFTNGSGATVTCIELGTYASGSEFYESGSTFGTTVTAYSYTVAAASVGATVKLVTREFRVTHFTQNASSPAFPTDQFGIIFVTRTNTTGQAFPGVMVPEGATGSIWVYATAGDVGVVPDAPFSPETSKTIINNTVELWHYQGLIYNSTVWLRVTAAPFP